MSWGIAGLWSRGVLPEKYLILTLGEKGVDNNAVQDSVIAPGDKVVSRLWRVDAGFVLVGVESLFGFDVITLLERLVFEEVISCEADAGCCCLSGYSGENREKVKEKQCGGGYCQLWMR